MLIRWLLAAVACYGAVEKCACDGGNPVSLAVRECSLTAEATRQPEIPEIFFLRDASPRKPNRTLALPRRLHTMKMQELSDLPPTERTALWTAAIAKAKELWGNDWGLAYNGSRVRTQCHLHIHIGKLLKGVDSGQAVFVRRVEDIPAPTDGTGLWVHPVGNRLKVHIKEQICETVLLR